MHAKVFVFLRWLVCLLVAFSLLLFREPVSAQQTTITVTSFADDITRNNNCTLREAVQAANTDQRVDACPAGHGADVILLPQGTYIMSIPGNLEDQNQTGDLDITADLTIQGAGANQSIISMAPTMRDRHLQIVNAGAHVVIRTLTLRDATYEMVAMVGVEPRGGSISNAGQLTVDGVSFIHNLVDAGAAGPGGAIYNNGQMQIKNAYFTQQWAGGGPGCIDNDGELSIESTLFEANSGYGVGVIANHISGRVTIQATQFLRNTFGLGLSVAVNQGIMNISGSTFEANDGEGMFFNSGYLQVEDTRFLNNTSSYNGTLENTDGNLIVQRSIFTGNTGKNGGGIEVVAANYVSIEASQFIGNRAERGGAVDIQSGRVIITDSVIKDNDASSNGAGIASASPDLSISGSTISGNVAAGQGGGMYLTNAFTMLNSTISGNLAVSGGGIYHQGGTGTLSFVTIAANQGSGVAIMGGKLVMRANILAGNQGGATPDCATNQSSPVLSRGSNFIGIRQNCPWTLAPGDHLGDLAHPLVVGLLPLANNGGLTNTHALQSSSIAVDAAGVLNCPGTDQRGFLRPAGPACDSGAFEVNASSAVEGVSIYLPMVSR